MHQCRNNGEYIFRQDCVFSVLKFFILLIQCNKKNHGYFRMFINEMLLLINKPLIFIACV
ncbi:Uncharacterised protein [Leminorella richardii]|uniref:Uncharacterized protein n=1 Tax=Leminorella richardii TaxID=158841 RepID=A0A2X4V413_9GAMM|nr:Uncharacterised protein [Leminorella richardii]